MNPIINNVINKTFNNPIILAKSIFFAVYAAASVLLPFLVLYYEQRGLSGTQMGLLAAIPPVMTMLGASALSGLWYQQFGSWGMYRWGGLVMIVGLLIFVVVSNVRVRTIAKQPVKLS